MTDDMGLMAELEKRLGALETAFAEHKRTCSASEHAKPDAVDAIASAIIAYAKTRRRFATTGYELRALCNLGNDVHGMSIDGALKRIERGAYPGITAKQDGDTMVPKVGTFRLWQLTVTSAESVGGGAR